MRPGSTSTRPSHVARSTSSLSAPTQSWSRRSSTSCFFPFLYVCMKVCDQWVLKCLGENRFQGRQPWPKRSAKCSPSQASRERTASRGSCPEMRPLFEARQMLSLSVSVSILMRRYYLVSLFLIYVSFGDKLIENSYRCA